MGHVILNSVPATVVSHSEGSSTVLSWLQRADATATVSNCHYLDVEREWTLVIFVGQHQTTQKKTHAITF